MGRIVDIDDVLLELGLSFQVTDEERAVTKAAIVKAEGSVRRYIKYDPVQTSHVEFYPQTDYNVTNSRGVWETNDTQAYFRRTTIPSTSEMYMKHLPIRTITEVRIDLDGRNGSNSNGFPDSTVKIQGTDYWANFDSPGICRDGIIRSFGLWPVTPGSVQVTYTAGYSSSEFSGNSASVDATPIHTAVLEESTRLAKKVMVNKKQTQGWIAGQFAEEELGDYRYVIDGTTASKLYGSSFNLMSETKEMLADFINYGWTLAS